jgi:hypothetical protein
MISVMMNRKMLITLKCTLNDLVQLMKEEPRVYMDEGILVSMSQSGEITLRDAQFRTAAIEGQGQATREKENLSIRLLLNLQGIYKLGVILVHIFFALAVLWFLLGLGSSEPSVLNRFMFLICLGGLEYILIRQVNDGFDRMERSLNNIFGSMEKRILKQTKKEYP